MEHSRQYLIFEKATANAQRRQRENLLRLLPQALSAPLSSADCTYFPESETILHRFLPVTAAGIGGRPLTRPSNYFFYEVGWKDKAIRLLPDPKIATSCASFLLLRPPYIVEFQEQQYWACDLPLFHIDFRWGAGVLQELWQFASGCVALVTADLGSGIVFDSYVGVLEDDPNPAEVVFEVAVWQEGR